MTEIWKPIPGYEGKYEVSSMGRVKSLARTCKLTGRTVSERVLKSLLSGNGYAQVCLWKDGVSKRVLVHRVVMEAFVGPCPEDLIVLHGPRGKHDNTLESLSYGTRSKNAKEDKIRDGTHIYGSRTYNAIMNETIVAEMIHLKRHGWTYKDLSAYYKIKHRTIKAAVTGMTWKTAMLQMGIKPFPG